MKTIVRIGDALLNRLAPRMRAEAGCILLFKYQLDNSDTLCRYIYDNCPAKTAPCNW